MVAGTGWDFSVETKKRKLTQRAHNNATFKFQAGNSAGAQTAAC
jgi:hypothetical protein